MDTVNVEDESQWMFPPFAGMIDDKTQRIISRGACDNKGGIVCALYTLYLLQQKIDGKDHLLMNTCFSNKHMTILCRTKIKC